VNDFSAAQRSRVTHARRAETAKVSKASVSRFIGDDRARSPMPLPCASSSRLPIGLPPEPDGRGLKRGAHPPDRHAGGRHPQPLFDRRDARGGNRLPSARLQPGGVNTDRDDEQERQHLALLRSYNIEGLIVNTLGHPSLTIARTASRNAAGVGGSQGRTP